MVILAVATLVLAGLSVIVAGCRAYNMERIATMEFYSIIDTVDATTLEVGDVIRVDGTLTEILAIEDEFDHLRITHETGDTPFSFFDRVDIYAYA